MTDANWEGEGGVHMSFHFPVTELRINHMPCAMHYAYKEYITPCL